MNEIQREKRFNEVINWFQKFLDDGRYTSVSERYEIEELKDTLKELKEDTGERLATFDTSELEDMSDELTELLEGKGYYLNLGNFLAEIHDELYWRNKR